MVGHPHCVFINYIWLNQLSNTTNLWWIDVYYLVINYMFRRFWPSSGWWINKNTPKQLHLACVFYTEDGGRLTTLTAEVRSTQHKSQYRGPIRKRISAQWYKQQRKDIVNIQYIITYYKIVRTAIPASTPYFDKKPRKNNPAKNIINAPTSTKTIQPSQTVVKSTIGITDPFTQHTVSQQLKF